MNKYTRRSLRVAGIYAIFGILWIVFSDRLLASVAGDAAELNFVQTIKGLAYIFFTASLVFFLVRRVLVRQDALSEQAARSEKRFQETFARAAVGIGHVSHAGTWVYVNDKLCELLHRSRDTTLGQEVAAMAETCDAEQVREQLRALLRGESSAAHLELRVPGDGAERWVLVTIVSSESIHGDEAAAVAFVEDISLRKQAEGERAHLTEQLMHAQKMEAVGRLAGGVAHDFNNMLGVITGYTASVLERCSENDGIASDLRQVLHAAERSAALTQQLLSFARKGVVNPRPLDLNAHLHNSEPLLQRLAGRQMTLQLEAEANLWPICMDPGQLDQVLANLTLNARDASNEAGTITIRTDNVLLEAGECTQITGATPGEYVRLSMVDTGCGMSEDVLKHVFEPFFTTKAVGKGTGLGLASVFGIVQQSRGGIAVSSTVGQGTTFQIYLPRYRGAVEDVQTQEGIPTPKRKRLIVVEDETQILRLLQRALERAGYEVRAYDDPTVALAEFQQQPTADVLVTDVLMPKMNGADLARQLVTFQPALRVLFISGHTASVALDCGINAHNSRFLQKPFQPAILVHEVAALLDGPATPV